MNRIRKDYGPGRLGSQVFTGWEEDILRGESPVFYPIAAAGKLAEIEIGPGLVTLIGGAPGAGKTAFVMQAIFEAMRLTESLKVVICNVEMTPEVLFDRQLARLSGVNLTNIRHRDIPEDEAEKVLEAMEVIEDVASRICFVPPPFVLDNIAELYDDFEADVILLDYIQRIPPDPKLKQHDFDSKRGSVDATMAFMRQWASNDAAVITVAAVSRQKDNKGRSSYAGDSLSLASIRESSALEFGADDAVILAPAGDDPEEVILKHLKSRHGEPRDIPLTFHRTVQKFEEEPEEAPLMELAELRALWNRTKPAREDI